MPSDDHADGFDESGWLIGAATPLPVAESYAVLAPDAPSLINGERYRLQAQKFFALDLRLTSPKRYPGGGWPQTDQATFVLARSGDERELTVLTLPIERAPDVRDAATIAGAAVGAGLDVLVARTRRIWQIPGAADDPFPLALSAVFASVLLGPVLPPGGGTVFGVKTARAHLERLGWRT